MREEGTWGENGRKLGPLTNVRISVMSYIPIVRGLTHIYVIVRVDGLLCSHFPAQQLDAAVGDNLCVVGNNTKISGTAGSKIRKIQRERQGEERRLMRTKKQIRNVLLRKITNTGEDKGA